MNATKDKPAQFIFSADGAGVDSKDRSLDPFATKITSFFAKATKDKMKVA